MRRILGQLRKTWSFLAALIIAVATGLLVPWAKLGSIATDLITFFGIHSAVILPATLVTAGTLRPEGLSLAEAQRYATALRRQMMFWSVLLAVDFTVTALLIAGKALAWEAVITFGWGGTEYKTDLAPLLSGLTFGLVGLALLRTAAIIRGVFSLQTINTELAVKAIEARNATALRSIEAQSASSGEALPAKKTVAPKGFGRTVRRKAG